MTPQPTVDSIPVAHTPVGGWTEWPTPVLTGCTEPLPAGAPDLCGVWQIAGVQANGERVVEHPMIGQLQRIEQAGDRIVITSGGVVHDMRCDGTLENGVHDVAAADKVTEVHVVATYEDGVHVLRPDGLPIEVRRWRDGEHLMWDYVGFLARLQRIGESDMHPPAL